MDFEDTLKFIGGVILAIIILIAAIYFIHYKFTDCKKVGHTTLYCLMDLN